MAEVEKMSKEEKKEFLEFNIWYEKKAKKMILICSAICCGLGLIGLLILGISTKGNMEIILALIFCGIWFGTGLGGAVSLVPLFFSHIKEQAKKVVRGESESWGIGITLLSFIFFLFVGPVGLLVRILRINHRIKNFKKELSELG